jgi:hypothetical protein
MSRAAGLWPARDDGEVRNEAGTPETRQGGPHNRRRGAPTTERGELHDIQSTGRAELKALNIYVSPTYTMGRDELAVG